ncbi:hypothetical protein GGR56DRAFT_533937 [Xylariaceae sp. FL0804]|nr:hypothetical protein GGR56DRAFT_533937 [Xylariaceae sp. FL0804]
MRALRPGSNSRNWLRGEPGLVTPRLPPAARVAQPLVAVYEQTAGPRECYIMAAQLMILAPREPRVYLRFAKVLRLAKKDPLPGGRAPPPAPTTGGPSGPTMAPVRRWMAFSGGSDFVGPNYRTPKFSNPRLPISAFEAERRRTETTLSQHYFSTPPMKGWQLDVKKPSAGPASKFCACVRSANERDGASARGGGRGPLPRLRSALSLLRLPPSAPSPTIPPGPSSSPAARPGL